LNRSKNPDLLLRPSVKYKISLSDMAAIIVILPYNQWFAESSRDCKQLKYAMMQTLYLLTT